MSRLATSFGYCPDALKITAGAVVVTPRDDLQESCDSVRASSSLAKDWIYAPTDRRIFALPKTHLIEHADADGPEHLEFLVWALSFFTGMRLTTREAGFVDATPVTRGNLVEFATLNAAELARALSLAEAYWGDHRHDPLAARRWIAAVHTLFLAQYPRALQYERVIYLYAALDACYRLLQTQAGGKDKGHPQRIPWMCAEFGVPVPAWAAHVVGTGSEITGLRSAAIHEALFMGEPLGFALHDRASAENLPLEMGHLVCRFLVALLGLRDAAYLRIPVSTYQTLGLDI